MAGSDDEDLVRPDGLSIRRLRHEHRWSSRDLVEAIGEASLRASGVRTTITPNLLAGMEEKDERVPRATLRLVADGLGCDPVDILKG